MILEIVKKQLKNRVTKEQGPKKKLGKCGGHILALKSPIHLRNYLI